MLVHRGVVQAQSKVASPAVRKEAETPEKMEVAKAGAHLEAVLGRGRGLKGWRTVCLEEGSLVEEGEGVHQVGEVCRQ